MNPQPRGREAKSTRVVFIGKCFNRGKALLNFYLIFLATYGIIELVNNI